MIEYRIQKRVKEQFDAFMSGFSELIPQELINVFDERELEVSICLVRLARLYINHYRKLLIGGMSEIDVYVSLIILNQLILTSTQ